MLAVCSEIQPEEHHSFQKPFVWWSTNCISCCSCPTNNLYDSLCATDKILVIFSLEHVFKIQYSTDVYAGKYCQVKSWYIFNGFGNRKVNLVCEYKIIMFNCDFIVNSLLDWESKWTFSQNKHRFLRDNVHYEAASDSSLSWGLFHLCKRLLRPLRVPRQKHLLSDFCVRPVFYPKINNVAKRNR